MNKNRSKGAAMAMGAVIGGAIGFILSLSQGNPALVGAGAAVGIAVVLAYNEDQRRKRRSER